MVKRYLTAATLLAGLVLTGCGFSPLYEPSSQAVSQFNRIYVVLLPDRVGQEMREALQARLDSSGDNSSKDLMLDVRVVMSEAGLGVQPNNSTTRQRSYGIAYFTLHRVTDNKTLTRGSVRALDGYDVMNGQFFGQDLLDQAIKKRILEHLADDITDHLALYFKAHPDLKPSSTAEDYNDWAHTPPPVPTVPVDPANMMTAPPKTN